MAKKNFQYLLTCYKSGRMTEEEWQDWKKMVENQRYKNDIVLDIELCLLSFRPMQTGRSEREDRMWEGILVSIGKNKP